MYVREEGLFQAERDVRIDLSQERLRHTLARGFRVINGAQGEIQRRVLHPFGHTKAEHVLVNNGDLHGGRLRLLPFRLLQQPLAELHDPSTQPQLVKSLPHYLPRGGEKSFRARQWEGPAEVLQALVQIPVRLIAFVFGYVKLGLTSPTTHLEEDLAVGG